MIVPERESARAWLPFLLVSHSEARHWLHAEATHEGVALATADEHSVGSSWVTNAAAHGVPKVSLCDQLDCTSRLQRSQSERTTAASLPASQLSEVDAAERNHETVKVPSVRATSDVAVCSVGGW